MYHLLSTTPERRPKDQDPEMSLDTVSFTCHPSSSKQANIYVWQKTLRDKNLKTPMISFWETSVDSNEVQEPNDTA